MNTKLALIKTKPPLIQTVEAQIKQLSLVERMHLLSVFALHQEIEEDGVVFIGEEGILEDEKYTVTDALIEHPLHESGNQLLVDICDNLNDASTREIRDLMVTLAMQIAR